MTALLALIFLVPVMSGVFVQVMRVARDRPGGSLAARRDSPSLAALRRPGWLTSDRADSDLTVGVAARRSAPAPTGWRGDGWPAAAVVAVRLPRDAALVLCGDRCRQHVVAPRDRGAVRCNDLSFAVTGGTTALA